MSRTGFIQNELDLKLLVLYIMARAAAPITFLQLLDLALFGVVQQPGKEGTA